MNFRPCEQCNACCKGQLAGSVYDVPFGFGKPCSFLVREKCTIYEDRPAMCKNYQCAWSQHLFPEECRPDKIGIMVSVENGVDKQYLKFILLSENVPQQNIDLLLGYAKQLNADVVIVPFVKMESK